MNDSQSILRLIESAESSLKSARELLKGASSASEASTSLSPSPNASALAYEEEGKQIIEGIFDGQNMIGPNERNFPIPANYASKSKLVEGDRLKLTIMPNGSFLYKQIEPIDREIVKGTLVREDGQFKVATPKGNFRVILAAVTYFKGQLGDEVSLVLPKDRAATWGAIEAIIPQMGEPASIDEKDIF